MAENKSIGSYDITREGEDITLRVDWDAALTIPSIEDSEICMGRIIDILLEVGVVSKIIFHQKRDYEYDFSQVNLLVEIARIYKKWLKEGIDDEDIADISCPASSDCTRTRKVELRDVIFRLMRADPLGAFVEIKRILRKEKIKHEHLSRPYMTCAEKYLDFLEKMRDTLEKTQLIIIASPFLAGYRIGDRSIYRKVFTPVIRPDFMYTKLMASYPPEGKELETYTLGNAEVTIFEIPDSVQTLYHLLPPEFKLSEEKYELLDSARRIMAEHKPTKQEFTDPRRMRQVFTNVGVDLLEELESHHNIKLKQDELKELSEILVRYTVGFGLIEVLLSDEKMQDISVNSPAGRIPLFIVHADYDDCVTNITPTATEAESWASKLRLMSGRPLDEANPILDTELSLPGGEARVAIITSPLNPTGLAYSFRRHRTKPWTLPLFIKNRMINRLAGGLLSFLVDGSRTMLIAGTRSAGKSAFLSSLLMEIMRRYRIITIEDTLELPVRAMRNLGYNIQSLKVASSMTRGTSEVTAAEGIRTTLRLGDSALIVGEVRSDEARALYEAMRVGALANLVAGTIHGDSPYGVFDRVVNDLNVPRTSFKATDIIIVANPLRSPDGLHRWRRITQITEVRKFWKEDPLTEGGFVDLMKYDATTDELQPSQDLINGDSEILKAIAGNVKQWAGNWDAIWDNVELRADCKGELIKMSEATKNPDLLEAEFVLKANDAFHQISEEVLAELGDLDRKRIFFRYQEWLKRSIKKQTFTK